MNLLVWLVLLGLITAFTLSSILTTLDSSSGQTDKYHLYEERTFRSPSEWPVMNGSFQNIFWMVQITDIHVSAYYDATRSSDLLRFCSEYLSIIDPEVVVITGDLTDAKDRTSYYTYQHEEEWKTYKKVTSQCRTLTRAIWLDVRGNHDGFGVLDHDSKNNYYRSHSAMGNPLPEIAKNLNGYHYKLHMPFGTYSFVGFDATNRPGTNRPFNFFGFLNDKEIQYIKELAGQCLKSNHTVWFGHFPTSLIVHDPPVLRDIMSNSIAYICGHLHTLGDAVPKMYTRHKTGMLELELGDWKVKRMFRIIAFDHDIMSFMDAYLDDWPLVLVTNPKDNQFYSIENEPVEMVKYSTHIRMLIFNPTPIVSAVIKIDKMPIGKAEHVKGPLYVHEWNPLKYGHGIHTIEITVTDEMGHTNTISQTFSVDGSLLPFRLIPRILLMPNLFSVGKTVFGAMVFLYTLILTSMRQCDHIRSYYIYGIPVISSIFNTAILKVWLASRAKSIYILLIGCVLYLTFGPWFADELLEGHYGVIFAWGIIFRNAFLTGGITYFYGIFQFLTFNLPLLFTLGHVLDMRRRYGSNITGTRYISTFFPVALLFAFSFILTVREFPRAYSFRSVYLGPLRTGNVFIVPLSLLLAFKSDVKFSQPSNGFH